MPAMNGEEELGAARAEEHAEVEDADRDDGNDDGALEVPAGDADVSNPPRKKKRWLCMYKQPAFAVRTESSAEGGDRIEKDGKYEWPQCKFYLNGHCKYGQDCEFQHDASSDDIARLQSKFRLRAERGEKRKKAEKWLAENSETGNLADYACPLFQNGCCWFDQNCWYKHVRAPVETGLKLKLCASFKQSGECISGTSCPDAHGKAELQVPNVYKDCPGYKTCICTYHGSGLDLGGCKETLCFHAHGVQELRRKTLFVPTSLADATFTYSDAHVHLDHVLLSRKFGPHWFIKCQPCKRLKGNCEFGPEHCLWLHDGQTALQRPLERQDFEDFAAEIKALPGEFGGLVHSGCDTWSIELGLRLVEWGRESLGGRVYVSFGIHPSNFEEYTDEHEMRLISAIEQCGPQAVAWGECGLDYFRRLEEEPGFFDRMKAVFARQLRTAVRLGLPVVVHSRDAEEDTFAVLQECVPRDHVVILHSYMGGKGRMAEFLEYWPRGYVSVTGGIAYEFSDGRLDTPVGAISEVLRELPLDRLLLETDGPYMAPHPFRGEESHSGHIPWVAEYVARCMCDSNVTPAIVLNTTYANFRKAYRIH